MTPLSETGAQRLTSCLAHSAILTKYTALRSYYETERRGSPLDYENAGVSPAAAPGSLTNNFG